MKTATSRSAKIASTPVPETSVEALIRLSRAVSEAQTPDEILPILADGAASFVAGAGVAVLKVVDGGHLELGACSNLPDVLGGFQADADQIGPELEAQLLAAAGKSFARASSLPLVSGGDLYGILLLLSGPEGVSPMQSALVQAISDLAAVTLHKNAQYAELSRSYIELRQSRQALARSEKLRALGEMSAGVAHDVMNVLNPLSILTQALRSKISPDATDALKLVEQMQNAIKTGTGLVRGLRDFARQERESVAEELDLNEVVESAVQLFMPRLRSKSRLKIEKQLGEPPPIRAGGSELKTALLNLLFNAFDAIDDRGSITLTTGKRDDQAFVEICDTGPGIPDEVRERVFEPFFTTKGDKGTGLGLAMVYAFVKRAGGRLELESATGQGTRFCLWFPAENEPRSVPLFRTPPAAG